MSATGADAHGDRQIVVESTAPRPTDFSVSAFQIFSMYLFDGNPANSGRVSCHGRDGALASADDERGASIAAAESIVASDGGAGVDGERGGAGHFATSLATKSSGGAD